MQTSNEQLATLIQSGRQDLIPQLWGQVLPWITLQAKRRYFQNNGQGGTEVEDLVQSAYFAVLAAVQDFDSSTGYSFLTFLDRPLRSAFAITCGYRTRSRDPLQSAASLDCPIDSEAEDGATLGDLQADPAAQEDFNRAEDLIYTAELKAALEEALALLPDLQAQILRSIYYDGQSRIKLSEATGLQYEKICREEKNGLKTIRRKYKLTKLKDFVEERTSYYSGTGLRHFLRTGSSSVEDIVLRREELRQWLQKMRGDTPPLESHVQ